jgi:hypothetical protein
MKRNYNLGDKVWVYDCPCEPRLAKIIEIYTNPEYYKIEYEEGREKIRTYTGDHIFKYPDDFEKLHSKIQDDAFYLKKTSDSFYSENEGL